MASVGLPVCVVAAILTLIIKEAYSLECFQCDSIKHPKCAETFGYTAEEVKKLNISGPCPLTVKKNSTQLLESDTCKKLVSDMPGSYGKMVVRTCNIPAELEDLKMNTCKDYREMTVCYCTKDNCNGQSHLLISFPFLLLPLLSVFQLI
ncbi:hypothetical protein CHS0354_042482 [Potamilus streckersoni]|uniref:Protein sleepless n=1 Tax=Potamilus streckersoni TaxID=2493646 RepID=A0AAE0SAA0_9BIVA|nr:hypothetical protein CHS0354_042482 [Potamilus streckersoni]